MAGEVLDGLDIRPDGIYIDCTFGRGGHSKAILEQLGVEGRLYALDQDPDAEEAGRVLERDEQRFGFERGSFAMLGLFAKRRGLSGKVNGILFDLGVSSPQLDDARRGFSFLRDGPLDMRMDTQSGTSAAQWLSEASMEEIAGVLWKYGEERFSRRIAAAIVRQRETRPLETTAQLADLVAGAVPFREKHKHPATRSFQAIRIAINHELDALESALESVIDVLAAGGRLVVISFHSLEDRIVKRFMRDMSRGDDFPPDLPVTVRQLNPRIRTVGKALRPAPGEVEANPRARSAVLRVAERLA